MALLVILRVWVTVSPQIHSNVTGCYSSHIWRVCVAAAYKLAPCGSTPSCVVSRWTVQCSTYWVTWRCCPRLLTECRTLTVIILCNIKCRAILWCVYSTWELMWICSMIQWHTVCDWVYCGMYNSVENSSCYVCTKVTTVNSDLCWLINVLLISVF